ncbi:hypothetical protein BRN32_03275 [Xanthomonas oryzae pv. oryzae]|nr:hypothetical protein [Xanthomonas oryzae]AXM12379.1 hypothetical protein BRN32_03275 [Xanthomonas oryzae pv. oryzae]
MREKNYPSDVSRERFEQIRPILEQARVDQVKLLAERYEATVGQIKVSVAQTFKNLFTIS